MEAAKGNLVPISSVNRRQVLCALAAASASARSGLARADALLTRPIPSSGERLPAIGLGSWITFNVGYDEVARSSCTDVIGSFFNAGGRLIDSSPMYGSSQAVIGGALKRLGKPGALFSADKVWTSPGSRGPAQIETSRLHWDVPRFDLLQVHNLLAWKEHLPTLNAMKAKGQLRYIGITTSEGRRHREVEEIMRKEPLDFVQVTYNVIDRDVESRILPLARERGLAVIINRPFQQGALIERVARRPLPPWAGEIGCSSWAQVLLKFIISHPAITCAIPATTSVAHVRENMEAAREPLPDEALRGRMAAHVAGL
jgi:diketogulonate reductase-like aldo/keto reductase